MEKVALLKQGKESRIIEHKNQQKHISIVDNRIAAMQRRDNMLSVIQRRVAYSTEYCDNINGASQKFSELDSDLNSALFLAKVNFRNQYGKNAPDKHWFIRIVERWSSTGIKDKLINTAWGQYVEYFLNTIIKRKQTWRMQKVVGNHRPDYYQLIDGGELYADLTSASQGGGNHVTSKLGGVTFTQPVCAADIMYSNDAMIDCIKPPSNHYKPFYIQTSAKETLIYIKNALINFSLNIYELGLKISEQNEILEITFGSKQASKQELSLKEICNRLECGIYQTPIEMVSDIQRLFSFWNKLINKNSSLLPQPIIPVMKHVMEVINSHIKKIFNAPTWSQSMQILQNRLTSI